MKLFHRKEHVELWVEIWVIYNHPIDHPDKIVARLWTLNVPTNNIMIGESVEEVRKQLISKYPFLVKLQRNVSDNPVILECWV